MLLLALLAILLPQARGEYLQEGDCPGNSKIPNQTVKNCNYYCRNGSNWDNTYFAAGTKCHYGSGIVGVCVNVDGEGTGCSISQGSGHETENPEPHITTIKTEEPSDVTTKRESPTYEAASEAPASTTENSDSSDKKKKKEKKKKEKEDKKKMRNKCKATHKNKKRTTPLPVEW
ncbi:uncharacterized protein [Dermacentor andersoni]|uniref:uncharacterized protein n=1 Tax=Dermacentor andersoni TaxID=34620 RepID=UPI0024175E58|nr:uncharacterized protein LOC129387450 [Dermacentor andersoni]